MGHGPWLANIRDKVCCQTGLVWTSSTSWCVAYLTITRCHLSLTYHPTIVQNITIMHKPSSLLLYICPEFCVSSELLSIVIFQASCWYWTAKNTSVFMSITRNCTILQKKYKITKLGSIFCSPRKTVFRRFITGKMARWHVCKCTYIPA